LKGPEGGRKAVCEGGGGGRGGGRKVGLLFCVGRGAFEGGRGGGGQKVWCVVRRCHASVGLLMTLLPVRLWLDTRHLHEQAAG
jgi:hypothetical protein